MAEMTSYENGTPCWADLGTPDLKGAIDFYAGMFGWDIEIGAAEMGHYSMATLRGLPVAALADQQQPGPVFWSTYIAVDDIDATVARVPGAGGTVLMEPMDVMTFGRMAIVTDPGGAQVSFWQAGDHRGASLVNEPGTMCWNELTTRAVDDSIGFLDTVAGLSAKKVGGDGMPYYELSTRSGRTVGGLMPMIGDTWPPEIPNHWMVYFTVSDTDASAARCAELGGKAVVPPTDIPPGRFAVLNDPQGAHFSILKLTVSM